tara:strand:+ start:747 stop:1190 length:444 start_codon:yes stop_codon:yes gene_type:complete
MAFISTGNFNTEAFTKAYGEFFDYFKKEVVVYKEPKKTVSDVQLSFLYGYGTDSNGDNYEFTPVSGVFSGLVVYRNNIPDTQLTEINVEMPDKQLMLKVEEKAKDYINNGRNDSLIIDDKKFFIKSRDIKEVFLTKNYYVYTLELSD